MVDCDRSCTLHLPFLDDYVSAFFGLERHPCQCCWILEFPEYPPGCVWKGCIHFHVVHECLYWFLQDSIYIWPFALLQESSSWYLLRQGIKKRSWCSPLFLVNRNLNWPKYSLVMFWTLSGTWYIWRDSFSLVVSQALRSISFPARLIARWFGIEWVSWLPTFGPNSLLHASGTTPLLHAMTNCLHSILRTIGHFL